jgi:2-dehydropantoate 2-reductase
MKWSKLLTNLLANATSAILNLTPAQIFADARLFRVEMAQLNEALAVMRALNAAPVDLPGVPVRLLAFGTRLPAFVARPLMQRAVGSGRGAKMPSFHIDLYSGRGRSEVAYLNGAVWRHGTQLGVPTPVNQMLTETLLALTSGEKKLGSVSVEEVGSWGI